jgi:ribosome-associated heat shock protein Hsp15
MAQKNEEDDKVRLDKWLWAARFYKTRALAKAAIESGKVHCRGERCKPGKEPRIGDEFVIRTGFEERTVVVQALSIVRRKRRRCTPKPKPASPSAKTPPPSARPAHWV